MGEQRSRAAWLLGALTIAHTQGTVLEPENTRCVYSAASSTCSHHPSTRRDGSMDIINSCTGRDHPWHIQFAISSSLLPQQAKF